MGNVTSPLLPKTQRLLHELGNRLKLARLRRGLEAKQVAERAGMAPLTLRSIERGSSTVTFGAYVAVMQVLGLAEDLNLVAKEDETGRHLQDAMLIQAKPRKRAANKSDYESDLKPGTYIDKGKGVHNANVKPKRIGTSNVGSKGVPPKPAPKKSASAKKVVRTPRGRETAASKLAAQIFKGGSK